MKKTTPIKIFLFFLIISIILTAFYHINNKNYQKIKLIQFTYIKHPESLPTKEVAKYTSFWFQNLRADLYWLQAIQYIWSNAIAAEYKKYLFVMLDLITELNPYFEKPYIIWQLLLPSDNDRYENFSPEERQANTQEAEKIWLKWIKNFCDPAKIELIKQEDNLQKIWSEEKYKNPCVSANIPYSLAFVYYFYLKQPTIAAQYYKIASANEDSLEWAKMMAAIMKWKWWEREKSFFMFLNIWKFIDASDEQCISIASQMEEIWVQLFLTRQLALSGELLEKFEQVRSELVWKWNEDEESEALSDTQCGNYINKAVRELNLAYIESANEKYKEKFNGKNAENAKVLFDEKFINYLPIDYQQYETYWIIYQYNKDTGYFDYEMGSYAQ